MDPVAVACYQLAHRTIRAWFESILQRPAGPMEAVCGEWMVAIECRRPCAPTESDVRFLGALMARRRRWAGPRMSEQGLGPRWIQPSLERLGDGAWSVGNVCVRGQDVLLFPHDPRHQKLFALLRRANFDDGFEGVCSALEVARLPRKTEVRSVMYQGAQERLAAPGFWLEAVGAVWTGAEAVRLCDWQRESLGGVGWTVEKLVDQLVETETHLGASQLAAIVVLRDARGRIKRCVFAFVRPSAWRFAAGSVLLFAYVARGGRALDERSI